MVHLFQIAPFLMAGITFYVAIEHFTLFYRLRTLYRISLTFAVFCVSCGIFELVAAGLYLATTPGEAEFWQRCVFMMEMLSVVCFIWFLQEYIAYPKKRGKYLWTCLFGGLLITGGLGQTNLLLDDTSYHLKLVWTIQGEQIGYNEYGPGILYSIMSYLIILAFVYLFVISVNYYLHGHQKEGKSLLLSFIILFIGVGNDVLVYAGVYQWIYVSNYALIGIMILMTNALSRKLVDSLSKYRQLYEDAISISEMKTNLITFTSHELKTPLVPILGWADFLKSGIERGKEIKDLIGIEEVDSIHRSAKRLTKIIETFLDLGALEAKKIELKKENNQITDIIAGAIQNVSLSAKSADIKIINLVESTKIFCDQFRMEQVFINILSNTIKYSPNGTEVKLSSKIQNERISIFCQDQGDGFSAEQLKTLWRPFIRTFSLEKGRREFSTGIGLYLSKLIVEMHGGEIDVDSKGTNQGTIVTIALPIK